MKTKLLILNLIILSGACTYQFPEEEPYAASDIGAIDIRKVIAVGDDYLAGVMDGALYHSGQLNSIPSVIAGQLNIISSVTFNQPDVESETGFNFMQSTGEAVYGKWIYSFEDISSSFPERILTGGEVPGSYYDDKSLLGNFAIPGLITERIDSVTLNENPYYNRIATSPGSSTLLSDITNSSPTFIILWLGMNDYLGYATCGANNKCSAKDNKWYSGTQLTSAEKFRQGFENTVEQLMQNSDCKMVVGNLPDVRSFPYFFWRPYNKLFLENLGAARSRYVKFNEAVAVFNRTVPKKNQRPFIDFFDNAAGLHPQPMVVIDGTLSDATYPDGTPLEKYRQLFSHEMVLLELTDKMVYNGYGSVIPLSEDLYLSGTEIMEIEDRVTSFNVIIANFINKYPGRIILADIAKEVNEIARASKTDAWGDPFDKTIFYADGVPVDGTLGVNSIFSIDGMHFNKRGNAFVANIFIRAINEGYKAKIPAANINHYPGNTFNASLKLF
jgi:hypothetical protein